MKLDTVRFSGKHTLELDPDGVIRHYETFESYVAKSAHLGQMVINAVKEEEIKRPTKILSIPRGSLIPTDIVSRMLGLTGDNVISMGLSFYTNETKNKVPRIGQLPAPQLVEDEVILVVDEVADSTDTLVEVDRILTPLGARAVYYGVVIDKLMPGTNRPQFAVATTDIPSRWVVFPNEAFESYGKTALPPM